MPRLGGICVLLFAALVLARPAMGAQEPGSDAAPGVVSHAADFYAPFDPQSALDMVERTPGFTFEKGGEEDPNSPTGKRPGNVLIDGQPPTAAEPLDVILKRIPASLVSRIDVIRGGGEVDMLGHPVVANVIVRRPARPTAARPSGRGGPPPNRASVTASLTSIPRGLTGGSFRADTQRRYGETTVDGSFTASRIPSNGSMGRRVRQSMLSGTTTVTDLDSYNWNERGEVRGGVDMPLAKGRLRINGAFSAANTESESVDTTLGGSESTRSGRTSRDRLEGTLRYSRRFGEKVQFESRLFQQTTQSSTHSVTSGRSAFNQTRTDGQQVAAASLRYERSPTLALETGAEGAYTWQSSLSDFAGARLQEADRTTLEAYANAFWKPKPKLSVDAGLRVEWAGVGTGRGVEDDFLFINPRVSMVWSATDQDQFTVTVERQVEPININNFAANLRRRDDSEEDDEEEIIQAALRLVPESYWTLRGRYQRRFGRGVFAMEVIHQERKDIVDRAPLPTGGEAYGNIGDGRRDSFIVSMDAPLDNLGVKGGFLRLRSTVRDSSEIDPFTNKERGRSGEQPWDWEARFSQELREWKARWGVDVIGSVRSTSWRRSEMSFTEREPNITAYAEYTGKENLTLRAEVRNLGDRETRSQRFGYLGNRNLGRLASVEERATRTAPSFFVSARRTF